MISNRRKAGVASVVCLCGLVAGATVPASASVDMYASSVVSASGLAAAPYGDALAVLGKPTLTFKEPNGNVFVSSLVAGPWNTDMAGGSVVITIETGGELTVAFTTPVEDDPANWYGKDFLIFGNSAFNGSTTQYITPTTDMAQYKISSGAAGRWDKSVVSVSQSADGPWRTFSTGPYADDFAPTQACAWDYIRHKWGPEMDFTKPVDPALIKSNFGGKTAAEGVDLYRGSGGGTAFDISGLDLPLNANGRKWIKYIKITGNGGEIDAFARVGHAIAPVSVGQAKRLADGVAVIVNDAIVSAGTDDFADCCYVQSSNNSAAIKVTGRIVDRGKRVIVYGVMGTANGEREIRSTSMETLPDIQPNP